VLGRTAKRLLDDRFILGLALGVLVVKPFISEIADGCVGRAIYLIT
jgi:hypothetical protein